MNKLATGGHGGTGWWLAQRVTAILMLLCGLTLAGLVWCGAPFDYASWRLLFADEPIKLLSWVLVASGGLHGWIGLRDVLMDYVKPVALRLTANVLVLLILAMCVVWITAILWGGNG